MRSSDIATRCREIALRVEISGEWGELAETLREAAAEVERLRLLPSVAEEIVAWSVDLHDARQENKRLAAEVERLLTSEKALLREIKIEGDQVTAQMAQIEQLRSQVDRLREDLSRSQLTLRERKAVAFAEQHFFYFKNQARTLRGLLKRLGGGA